MKNLIIIYLIIFMMACEKKSEPIIDIVETSNIVSFSKDQILQSDLKTGKIEMRNIITTVSANGVLDVPPQNMASVSAILGGMVRSTRFLQGMRVKKGEVLAIIENPEFIKIQSLYLENNSKLQFAEEEFKRQKELSIDNIGVTKSYQQAKADYQTLAANVGAYKAQLKMLNINPNLLSKNNIKSKVNIISPIDGYVVAVNVNIGRFVNPQDIMFEIVDTDHLHVELIVFEKDISKIKVGQKIRFKLSNNEDIELKASVFLINHQISAERTVRIHAHLDSENPSLMPNMYVKALIEISDKKVTTLPEKAVVNFDSKQYIFRQLQEESNTKSSKFESIEVKKGSTYNGFVEIILPKDIDYQQENIVINGSYDVLSKMKNVDED